MNNLRHRILAIFVSILMTCSFLPLQVFANEADFSIESDAFTPIKRTITSGVNNGRKYLEYNPTWRNDTQNAINRAGSRLFIVIPDSSSPFDFDEWAKIAENDDADLLVCLPRQDEVWDESDYTYLESVYAAGTSGYRTEGASKHIAAYGDGGIPASLFAVQRTSNIATMALVDADVADISEAAKTSLPLAVLLINAKTNAKATSFVDYFKAANETNDTVNVNANEIIYQRTGSDPWNPDYSKSHFVRLLGAQSGPVGQTIFDELFHRVGRWTTIPNENTLRPRAWPDEVEGWEIIEEDAQLVNGTAIKREASIYVPSKVRSGEITGSVPVVMLFHGISANGSYHTDQTDWYKTAEENNFILYAPTGYNHTWSNTVNPTGVNVNDLEYFSSKIDEFTTTGIDVNGSVYKIDPARVYLTGFSMGGGFVTAMAMRYPGKVAAVAPLASANNGVGTGDRVAGAVPYWFTIGSADTTNGSHPQAVSYFLHQAGVIPTDNITNVAGINAITEKEIKNYSAYDQDDRVKVQVFTGGSVEIRYAVANNIAHGIMNEYADYIWSDFFSRYEKVNGESVLIEDMSDGKVRVSLGGSAALTIADEAEYILSVANANKLATVTVWFEVDGEYLSGKDALGLNGFSVINGVQWQNTEDSTWVGRVTLGNLGGSLTENAYTDILSMRFGLKALGVTTVKVTRVELSGYDQDGTAIPFAYVIRNGAVETKIAQWYSVYDLNRDEKVDQLDLTIAQKYYAVKDTDDNWDEAKIANVNGDNRVDIEDLILILNNIIW